MGCVVGSLRSGEGNTGDSGGIFWGEIPIDGGSRDASIDHIA